MTNPVGIPGMGLGSASVAFEVFQGIKTGYEMFQAAVNMPEDYMSQWLRLEIESARLLDWGDLAGLSDSKDHPEFDRRLKANRSIILAILSEMKTLMDKMRKIGLRSDDVLSHAVDGHVTQSNNQLTMANQKEELTDAEVERFGQVLNATNEELRHERGRRLRHLKQMVRISRGVVNVTKQPGRIYWALSDKDAFDAGLGQLKELTDHLHESLSDYQIGVLLEQSKEMHMAILPMTRSMDDLKEIMKLLVTLSHRSSLDLEMRPWLSLGEAVTGPAGSALVPVSGSTNQPPPKTLFEQLTQFRYKILELEAKTSGDAEMDALELQGEHLKNLTLDEAGSTGTGRIPAIYKGGAVWIEWKAYKPILSRSNWVPSPQIADKVQRLVAVLHTSGRPTQFRVPLCEGYFNDDRNMRFGLVYKLPDADSGAAEVVSLSQLVQHPHRATPSLRSRLGLAKELATSLYFLHTVNWLHKGLCGESIVVPVQGGVVDYSRPYMSGFEYSRPDEQDQTSTAAAQNRAVYMHPDYLDADAAGCRKPYRKTFDIYSMGVILLEIAWWKPAAEIFGFERPMEPTAEKAAGTAAQGAREPRARKTESLADLLNIRKRLLTDEPGLLEHVAVAMGPRYCDAVRVCIGGLEYFGLPAGASETRADIASLLQQAYLQLVVDVLRGINV